jgi:hypothetical protein
MVRLLFTLIIMISFLGSFGQNNNVRVQIDSSYICVKKSWSSANNALGEIQKCNIAVSVNELQFYASKVKSEIDEAMSQAKKAGYEADGAEGEAYNIGCSGAEKGAGKAEKYFKKANDNFDDASTKLINAMDEDNGNYLIDYLNTALTDIENGMNHLKKGIDELNGALGELYKCK